MTAQQEWLEALIEVLTLWSKDVSKGGKTMGTWTETFMQALEYACMTSEELHTVRVCKIMFPELDA